MSVQKKLYIIVLDDDPDICRLISRITEINCLPFTSPEKLLERASFYQPVAVFVDVHLNIEVLGIEYIKPLRQIWPHVPILVLTSDIADDLIVKSLALGASDFIQKPIRAHELRARLQCRLFEAQEKQDRNEYQIKDISFNPNLSLLRKGEISLNLAPLDAKLMLFLINNIGVTIDKNLIHYHLWGDTKVETNTIDKRLSNIRKALRQLDSKLSIETVYGGKIIFRE